MCAAWESRSSGHSPSTPAPGTFYVAVWNLQGRLRWTFNVLLTLMLAAELFWVVVCLCHMTNSLFGEGRAFWLPLPGYTLFWRKSQQELKQEAWQGAWLVFLESPGAPTEEMVLSTDPLTSVSNQGKSLQTCPWTSLS